LGSSRSSCGKGLGTDVELAAVPCPEVFLRSPSIHTYSHTRRFQEYSV
jgi:hypothetical protein